MEFNEYQHRARESSFYKDTLQGEVPFYPMLGLCGEVGEVAEHIKKAIRDDGGKITPERRAALLKECGDCTWYLSDLIGKLGFTFDEVAQANLDKLADRRARGVLHGSGSNR